MSTSFKTMRRKTPSKGIRIKLYLTMKRIRLFEERVSLIYPSNGIRCPVHLCIGQEAVAAGVCLNLKKSDYMFSNHRGHGHCLAKGADMKRLMAELYGKKTGLCKGWGGSMHLADKANGIHGTTAIVGGGIPLAVGAALSSRLRGDGRITAVFFGDGALDEGAFYESVNFASLKKLPVLFVCENNLYATNSHRSKRQSAKSISALSEALAVPGMRVDGNDAIAVFHAAKAAAARARSNNGPTLIEALTYRWKGHVGVNEDHGQGIRPGDELARWKRRCPVKNLERSLIDAGVFSMKDIKGIELKLNKEIDLGVKFAEQSRFPSPSELRGGVYGHPWEQ